MIWLKILFSVIALVFISCDIKIFKIRLKRIHQAHQYKIKQLSDKGLIIPLYEQKPLEYHLKRLSDNQFLKWYTKWYSNLNTVYLPNGTHMPLTDYLYTINN